MPSRKVKPFVGKIWQLRCRRLFPAAVEHGYSTIAIAGGVSANSGVRESLQKACDKRNFTLYMPPLSLCGDNGAMIACAGSYAFDAGIRADSSLNASATMELTDWGNMGNGR